jgi:hypothetical protein
MSRTPLRLRSDPLVQDPVDRTLQDISGDIRDRLTALLNATQLIRLVSPSDDPNILSGLRMIEQQVKCLGLLADEICRNGGWSPVPASSHDGPHPSEPRHDD